MPTLYISDFLLLYAANEPTASFSNFFIQTSTSYRVHEKNDKKIDKITSHRAVIYCVLKHLI